MVGRTTQAVGRPLKYVIASGPNSLLLLSSESSVFTRPRESLSLRPLKLIDPCFRLISAYYVKIRWLVVSSKCLMSECLGNSLLRLP